MPETRDADASRAHVIILGVVAVVKGSVVVSVYMHSLIVSKGKERKRKKKHTSASRDPVRHPGCCCYWWCWHFFSLYTCVA